MNKKTLAVTFSLVIILLGFSANLHAQSNNPCLTNFNWWFWISGLPLGATCYTGWSFAFTPCVIPNTVCSPQPECPSCEKAAHPVDLATGNTDIEEMDLRIPGLGGGLQLERTWNSKWPSTESAFQVGLFGPNWRSTYEERILLGFDNYIRYSRGNGDFWLLATTDQRTIRWHLRIFLRLWRLVLTIGR